MSAPDPASAPATTLDRLVGDWDILQLRRGQRFSTDDILTAWVGLRVRPQARRVLDLGHGVGSVGLFALHHLPAQTRLVGVELQANSAALAAQNAARNGVGQRVEVRAGDLRDPEVCAGLGRFDLVLANPPYLPPGTALVSPYPERALARLELHGDVFDWCRVAAEHLEPEGAFVLCHSARDPRPEEALRQCGLTLRTRLDVVFRAGDAPMIAVRVAGWGGTLEERAPVVIRGADGAQTQDWLGIRDGAGPAWT